MKGTITIELNEASMLDALQKYINVEMVGTHIVTNIRTTNSITKVFEITVEAVEPKKE